MLIWQLHNLDGATASCHVRRDAEQPQWRLTVYRGGEVMLTETCNSQDAWHRSTEIWSVMLELGWTEPRH